MAYDNLRSYVSLIAVTSWWPMLFVKYLSISLGFVKLIAAFQVTLLDTTRTESLEWVTYSQQDDSGRRGWREASYTNIHGDVFRVYTVCNVAVTSVDNWIRTPYILRDDSHRIYIEVKFTMRKCTKYPDPGRLQQCKESFKLLYYEAESDFANVMMPTWDEDTYHHVDVIAANKVFTDINDAIINTETRSVSVSRQGVYFAFYDQGACATLLSIRIFYILCPSVVVNFAVFPNTTTGPEMTSIVQKNGICVDYAVMEQVPSYLCKGDGNWYFATGHCKCMPGYEPDEMLRFCVACQPGTFKWQAGNINCQACPDSSESTEAGSLECGCVKGFFRGPSDDRGMPCTRPPSEPQNLRVTFQNQSTVELSWEIPNDLGRRSDVQYRIACAGCPTDALFWPSRNRLNTTSVSVSRLAPNRKYVFTVYCENGVSQTSGVESQQSLTVTTDDAAPSKITNLRVISIGARYISLGWDAPNEPHVHIDNYDVTYNVESSTENATSLLTKEPNATFVNLLQQTKYAFRVRGKSEKTWGEYSDTISATTGLISHHPSDNPVGIIAGSAVAVLLCMLIVIVMVIIFIRRNQTSCSEKNPSDCDTLHYSNVQCPHVLDGSHIVNGTMTPLPVFSPPGVIRTYVDPYTYEDPSQAVREFTKEIDASFITIESVIGGGEFGDVCKGKLNLLDRPSLTVAIKTLKSGASDKNRLDFLTEASIMGQFDDANVIYLEGVVTKSHPIMIVTEFMENGSLDIFLRKNDDKFTMIQMVGMLRGIASGMRYLSEMGYVHRDLAARNVLVSETLVCKVADFGLSREIENDSMDGEYTTKGGKIPVRWTAPEAIAYRKFTSASDVWSYGVVTWEVISYGERPYWNWSNQDVIKAVDRDFMLPPPMNCPETMYQLMTECWQKDRAKRPKFVNIVKTLDKLIRAPELLRAIALPGPNSILLLNSDVDDVDQSTVEQWLTEIKMERYLESFLQAGLISMDKVVQMTLKDLLSIGVTLIGHQKKMMNSIQTLHSQVLGVQSTDGYLV